VGRGRWLRIKTWKVFERLFKGYFKDVSYSLYSIIFATIDEKANI